MRFLYPLYFIALVIIFMSGFEYYLGTRVKGEYQEAVGHRFIRLKENDPNINSVVWPNETFLAGSKGLVKKDYKFRTNQDGYILPDHSDNFSPKRPTFTVLFLGESSTESMYVDEEKRWPIVAANKAAKKLNVNIKVLNSGVSGNNSFHSLDILINKSIKEHIDLVVVDHNINDLVYLLLHGQYHDESDDSKSLILYDDYSIRSLFRYIKNKTFPLTWNILKKEYDLMSFKKKESDYENPYKYWNKMNDISKEYAKSIEMIISVCRINNINVVLAQQSFVDIGEIDEPYKKVMYANNPYRPSDWLEKHEAFNEVVGRVAKEDHVAVIDLRPFGKSEYIYDQVHYNEKGSVRVGDAVGDAIAQMIEDLPKYKAESAPR